MAPAERRRLAAGLALVAAAAAWCRLWRAFAEPLWLDEAYSAYAAAHGFRFLWTVVPRYETHPPFYYTLVRLWTLVFGDGLASLRAIGLLAGLLTPPALGLAAAEAGRWLGWDAPRRRRLAFAAVALAAVSIPLVEMSRQVRPYPLMVLAYAIALAALIRLARGFAERRSLAGGAFALYLLMAELMLWMHSLGPFWAAALALACAAAAWRRARPRDWAWLAAGHAGVGLLYLPCLLIVLDQAPTWVATTWLHFSWSAMWLHLAVLYAVPGWQAGAAALLAVLGAAGLWRDWSEGRRLLAILLPLALVPSLLAIAVSVAVSPVFITRVLTPVAVPTLLLFAVGTVRWPRPLGWAGVAAAVMLGANMGAVDVQARTGPPPQDWYGALAWLQPRLHPGDVILAYPNEGALPLGRALRDEGLAWPVRPIPGPVPSFAEPGARYPTGSRGVVSLPPARLEAIARAPETEAVPTVWLLRLGPETYDPGDVFLRALHRDRVIVRHLTDGPIDITGLRRVTRLTSPTQMGRRTARAAGDGGVRP